MLPDNRLLQKQKNLRKAFEALNRSVTQPIEEPRDLSGIIKDFEITYELAWKTLKSFLEDQGHTTTSAKDAFSQAYQLKHLGNAAVWLEMIADRNLAVHTYDEQLARDLCDRIRSKYVPAFNDLLRFIAPN